MQIRKCCRTFALEMKRFLVILISALVVISTYAQPAAQANSLFENGNYAEALAIYEQLAHKSPKNLFYTYRYARCLQETGQHSQAISRFSQTGVGQKYPLSFFFTAESYMSLSMPDEALEAYDNFLKKDKNTSRLDYIHLQQEKARLWQRYLKRVQKVEITDSVTLPLSSLLSAYSLSAEAGTLSLDTNRCLTYTNQRADRRLFTTIQDSVFMLARQYRLLNRWAEAEVLPLTVNFTDYQNHPFSLSDGVTTYFAARDTNGFGGLDIYVTRYNSATDSYTKPENIGLPFNSESNDYLFVIDEQQQLGYFATDRFSGNDSVTVYQFLWHDEPQYLEPMPADTLGLYAQLKLHYNAQKPIIESNNEQHNTINTNQIAQQNTISLLISEDKVYHSEKDFRTEEGLTLYRRYLQQAEEIDKMSQELETKRLSYSRSNADNKKVIGQEITQIESRLEVLQQRQQQVLTRIRTVENQ